jgi:hypothetical protein
VRPGGVREAGEALADTVEVEDLAAALVEDAHRRRSRKTVSTSAGLAVPRLDFIT